MSLSLDTASCGNNITVEGSASLLTYDCHRTVPAPFLTKTYHLVDDPATDDIVSWGEDETTFVVWRPPEFARDLLPNYFKHNNFSSFVRQLNTYGFRKIVPDHWEFANKFFRRGEKQLLCEIHRRKSSQYGSGASDVGGAPGSQSASPTNSSGPEDQGGPWSPFPSPLSSPSTILLPQGASTLMSDENERLRHDNRMLLLELSRLRRLYDDLVLILQQQSKVSLQAELPNSSRLHTLGDHKATISEQIEAAARRSELLRFKDSSLRPPSVESAYLTTSTRSDTPRASTLSFLDGKLREMASASGMASTSSSPKLFGVSLQNVKPWSSSQEAVAHKRPWGVDGSVEGGPPKPGDEGGGSSSRKGMKVELGLELSRPGIMSRERPVDQEESGQPWLRISATERVFM